MQKLLSALFLLFFILLNIRSVSARDTITNWYIKDLRTEIIVNKDSSLDITEWITADCGNLVDKHGIFRVLPTGYYKSPNDWVSSPVKLESITDFDGNKAKYTQTKDYTNHTITWKIGDPSIEVQGVNYYLIKYRVDNVIRFDNANYDKLYWNLNGAFWDLEIDNFSATVTFPSEINLENIDTNLTTGTLSSTTSESATQEKSNNILKVTSSKTLDARQAISVSINLPKIFTPYEPGSFQKYGWYLSLLLPIFAFWLSYGLWSKYGRDPKGNNTIVPEFGIPDHLSPLELGMILTDGTLETKFISAEIINLAVIGVIKIEKIEKKGLFGVEDYKIIKTGKNENFMSKHQKSLLDKMFYCTMAGAAFNLFFQKKNSPMGSSMKEIKISELKNVFYPYVAILKQELTDDLKNRKLLIPRGKLLALLICLGAVVFGGIYLPIFLMLNYNSPNFLYMIPSLVLSGIIFFVFAGLIKQRSPEGLVLLNKIKGFELYMKTAEKYRQQFNEKENIFEKFLPYAVMFGITKEWVKKMKDIYGEQYFVAYHPIWFVGGNFGNFDIGGVESAISSMSSSMNSTMSAASSGGGGGAGGGGGGGGGGGW